MQKLQPRRIHAVPPLKIDVAVPERAPYTKIEIVGPIVLDLIRRSLSFTVEYQLLGHTIREAVAVHDGPRRTEKDVGGKRLVSVEIRDDFSNIWDKIKDILVPELERLVSRNIQKTLQ